MTIQIEPALLCHIDLAAGEAAQVILAEAARSSSRSGFLFGVLGTLIAIVQQDQGEENMRNMLAGVLKSMEKNRGRPD